MSRGYQSSFFEDFPNNAEILRDVPSMDHFSDATKYFVDLFPRFNPQRFQVETALLHFCLLKLYLCQNKKVGLNVIKQRRDIEERIKMIDLGIPHGTRASQFFRSAQCNLMAAVSDLIICQLYREKAQLMLNPLYPVRHGTFIATFEKIILEGLQYSVDAFTVFSSGGGCLLERGIALVETGQLYVLLNDNQFINGQNTIDASLRENALRYLEEAEDMLKKAKNSAKISSIEPTADMNDGYDARQNVIRESPARKPFKELILSSRSLDYAIGLAYYLLGCAHGSVETADDLNQDIEQAHRFYSSCIRLKFVAKTDTRDCEFWGEAHYKIAHIALRYPQFVDPEYQKPNTPVLSRSPKSNRSVISPERSGIGSGTLYIDVALSHLKSAASCEMLSSKRTVDIQLHLGLTELSKLYSTIDRSPDADSLSKALFLLAGSREVLDSASQYFTSALLLGEKIGTGEDAHSSEALAGKDPRAPIARPDFVTGLGSLFNYRCYIIYLINVKMAETRKLELTLSKYSQNNSLIVGGSKAVAAEAPLRESLLEIVSCLSTALKEVPMRRSLNLHYIALMQLCACVWDDRRGHATSKCTANALLTLSALITKLSFAFGLSSRIEVKLLKNKAKKMAISGGYSAADSSKQPRSQPGDHLYHKLNDELARLLSQAIMANAKETTWSKTHIRPNMKEISDSSAGFVAPSHTAHWSFELLDDNIIVPEPPISTEEKTANLLSCSPAATGLLTNNIRSGLEPNKSAAGVQDAKLLLSKLDFSKLKRDPLLPEENFPRDISSGLTRERKQTRAHFSQNRTLTRPVVPSAKAMLKERKEMKATRARQADHDSSSSDGEGERDEKAKPKSIWNQEKYRTTSTGPKPTLPSDGDSKREKKGYFSGFRSILGGISHTDPAQSDSNSKADKVVKGESVRVYSSQRAWFAAMCMSRAARTETVLVAAKLGASYGQRYRDSLNEMNSSTIKKYVSLKKAVRQANLSRHTEKGTAPAGLINAGSRLISTQDLREFSLMPMRTFNEVLDSVLHGDCYDAQRKLEDMLADQLEGWDDFIVCVRQCPSLTRDIESLQSSWWYPQKLLRSMRREGLAARVHREKIAQASARSARDREARADDKCNEVFDNDLATVEELDRRLGRMSYSLSQQLDGSIAADYTDMLLTSLATNELLMQWHVPSSGSQNLQVVLAWKEVCDNAPARPFSTAPRSSQIHIEVARCDLITSQLQYAVQHFLDALHSRHEARRSSAVIDSVQSMSISFAMSELLLLCPNTIDSIVICCPPLMRLVPWHLLLVDGHEEELEASTSVNNKTEQCAVSTPNKVHLIEKYTVRLGASQVLLELCTRSAAKFSHDTGVHRLYVFDGGDGGDNKHSSSLEADTISRVWSADSSDFLVVSGDRASRDRLKTRSALKRKQVEQKRKKREKKFSGIAGAGAGASLAMRESIKRNVDLLRPGVDALVGKMRGHVATMGVLTDASESQNAHQGESKELEGSAATRNQHTTGDNKELARVTGNGEKMSGDRRRLIQEPDIMDDLSGASDLSEDDSESDLLESSNHGDGHAYTALSSDNYYAGSGGGDRESDLRRSMNSDRDSLSVCRVLHIISKKTTYEPSKHSLASITLSSPSRSYGADSAAAVDREYTSKDVASNINLRNCSLCVLSKYSLCDDITDARRGKGLEMNVEFIDALLFAGATTVLHPLWLPPQTASPGWSLARIAGVLFMFKFYIELPLMAARRLSVALACQKAQLWLKNVTDSEAIAFVQLLPLQQDALNQIVLELSKLSAGRTSADKIGTLLSNESLNGQNLDPSTASAPTRPSSKLKGKKLFSHPLYWGAFVVVGQCGFVHPPDLALDEADEEPSVWKKKATANKYTDGAGVNVSEGDETPAHTNLTPAEKEKAELEVIEKMEFEAECLRKEGRRGESQELLNHVKRLRAERWRRRVETYKNEGLAAGKMIMKGFDRLDKAFLVQDNVVKSGDESEDATMDAKSSPIRETRKKPSPSSAASGRETCALS